MMLRTKFIHEIFLKRIKIIKFSFEGIVWMNHSIRRLIAFFFIVVLTLGPVGCYDKKSCDQVCDLAIEFSNALIECDEDAILELSSEQYNFVNTRGYLSKLDFEKSFDSDKLEVVTYIHDSITFSVDMGSVDASAKDGSAEIDVEFTMVDYNHVCSDAENMKNLGLLMRMLKFEERERTILVTIQFTYENDEWKVSNLNDIYKSVYSFLSLDISFPNRIIDAVDSGNWYYADETDESVLYKNTTVIDMDLVLNPEIRNVDCSGVYYTVSFNDEVIYTSDTGTLVGIYGEEQEPDYNDDGYLKTGQYTISFYDENDHLLYSDTAIVICVQEE